MPLEVGYVARLPVMESKSRLIREKEERKKMYITSSEAIAKLRSKILYRLCTVWGGNWQFVASDFQFPVFFAVDQNASFSRINIPLGTDGKKWRRKIIEKKKKNIAADKICTAVMSLRPRDGSRRVYLGKFL